MCVFVCVCVCISEHVCVCVSVTVCVQVKTSDMSSHPECLSSKSNSLTAFCCGSNTQIHFLSHTQLTDTTNTHTRTQTLALHCFAWHASGSTVPLAELRSGHCHCFEVPVAILRACVCACVCNRLETCRWISFFKLSFSSGIVQIFAPTVFFCFLFPLTFSGPPSLSPFFSLSSYLLSILMRCISSKNSLNESVMLCHCFFEVKERNLWHKT